MDHQAVLAALPDREAEFPPCYAFSVHKSGSTMMNKMIGTICKVRDIPSIALPNLFFDEAIPPRKWSQDPGLKEICSRNLLYFGFRFLPPVFADPDFRLKERRCVLLVRDPRDALVSQYFSFGKKDGSHRLPTKGGEEMLARRQALEDLPIDEYVLGEASRLHEKLADYRDALNPGLTLMRRYEDVFFDKATFLGEIFAHFGLEVPQRAIERVAANNDVRPEKEDPTQHIRKGTPGDHAEKLAPETIASLNDTFRDVGAFYGYTL